MRMAKFRGGASITAALAQSALCRHSADAPRACAVGAADHAAHREDEDNPLALARKARWRSRRAGSPDLLTRRRALAHGQSGRHAVRAIENGSRPEQRAVGPLVPRLP